MTTRNYHACLENLAIQPILHVVCDEHTLGYIYPEQPEYVGILRASVIKGAPFSLHDEPKNIGLYSKVRKAKREDFIEFRVCVPSDFVE